MNITLIGMPASGKSIVGVLLAKRLGMNFIDGDLLIQQQEGRLLKEIIAQDGLDRFLDLEAQVHCQIHTDHSVIAPGGSVIYRKKAMEYLKQISTIVYLKISYSALKSRLGDLNDRGVAIKSDMTLRDLYHERVPLYERYADLILDEKGLTTGQVVDRLRNNLFLVNNACTE